MAKEIPPHAELLDEHIQMIKEALVEVGKFGQVIIMVENGKIRFMKVEQSYDALKWQPGAISGDKQREE